MLETEVGRLDIAFCAASVETLALEFVGQHTAVLRLLHQRVGNLDRRLCLVQYLRSGRRYPGGRM